MAIVFVPTGILFALGLLQTPASPAPQQQQQSNPAFPISTDRPTYSDSPVIVPMGHPQIEAGATWTKVGSVKTITYPEFLYRQALNNNLEIRLADTYATASDGATQSGLQDALVGFKWKFLYGVYTGPHRQPDLGIEVSTTVPIGSSIFRVNASQPSARLLVQYNTDPNTQIGGNLVVSSLGPSDQRFTQYGISAFISHNVDPKTAPFLEYYAFLPEARGGPTAQFVDVGTTYLLSDRWQFDIRYGTAFNQSRDGIFIGAGLSYRF